MCFFFLSHKQADYILFKVWTQIQPISGIQNKLFGLVQVCSKCRSRFIPQSSNFIHKHENEKFICKCQINKFKKDFCSSSTSTRCAPNQTKSHLDGFVTIKQSFEKHHFQSCNESKSRSKMHKKTNKKKLPSQSKGRSHVSCGFPLFFLQLRHFFNH